VHRSDIGIRLTNYEVTAANIARNVANICYRCRPAAGCSRHEITKRLTYLSKSSHRVYQQSKCRIVEYAVDSQLRHRQPVVRDDDIRTVTRCLEDD